MHTLTTFFDWLLTASLRASVLTLGVWLVQGMLQRHLSPRWRYALWLPVLVVLLMPVLPESRWSAASVFTFDAPALDVPAVSVVEDAAPVSMPAPSVLPVETARPVDWPRVRVLTWAVGALLVLLTGMVSFTRTLTRARRTREAISDELASRIDEVTLEVGLKQKPQLLMSSRIQSPAVTGLLRPLLLLPPGFDRDFTAEEKRLILQHELMHLKRGDLPLNTLLCVLMALHWFNPLLWLVFFKVRADREAACDAQVLENATPQRRSAYGHALLKIESTFSPLRLSLGFIGILQRHASLRARIRSIAAPTRTRPLTGLLTTLCIFGMTFLGVTRAEKPAETKAKPALMQLEVHILNFKEASNWDFGGRLPPFASDATPLLYMATLSQPELDKLKRETLSQPGADQTSYPKMTIEEGKPAVIRSVVNQPVASDKKDKNGKPAIEYLPIGFIGNFTAKQMLEGKLHLDVDIKNSQIIGETQVAGNPYPIVRSVVYQAPVELSAGMSTVVYGWELHHQNQKPRPVLYVLTPSVVATESAESEKKPSPAKITADEVTFDEKTAIGRYTGHARLEMSVADEKRIIATSDEIIYCKQDDLVIVKAPLEVRKGKLRITGEEKGAEAQINLKNGQWQLSGGKFKTVLTSETLPKQADSPAAASAAILRTAPAVRYHFKKERLGDILQRLAKEAGISLLSLPDASPDAGKLITFATELSPFSTIEVLCKANGLGIYRFEDQWFIQRLDHREFFSKLYAIPELDAPRISMLIEDIDAIIDAKSFQGDQKPQAVYKKDQKGIYVTGTRLHHVWVNGYLEAAGKTKLMK